MIIEIKHCYNKSALFSIETANIKTVVEAAVKSGVSLSGSELSYVDLSDANLSGAPKMQKS